MNFDDLIPGNKGLSFDDLVPQKKADPKIGRPEELSWAEKNLAPILEKFGVDKVAGGNVRGSAVGRAAMGAADPGVAVAQLAANAMGQGEGINKRIQEVEGQYQDARKAAGSEGFDPLRAAGATGMSLMVPGAMAAGSGVVRGALTGGAFGALEPARDGGENFWTEKAKQAGTGAAAGAVISPLMGALARVISPKASTNAELKLLRDADVNPTVGQALGGWANTAEEKLMSLPIMGDAIGAARRGAVKDFNNAVLNTATGPIGEKIEGAGFDAVASAGNKLGGAYNKAAAEVGHVNFDTPTFNAKFAELQDLTSGLAPELQTRFQKVIDNELLRRMSPNGSVAGAEIKNVDSALGKIAAEWRKAPNPSDREFGHAVRQLQQIFRDQLAESNPAYAAAKNAADTGWRTFRLARNAAAAAQNREGVFTPGQFNSAIRGDAGRAAVGEGKAFMQDVGQAAQNVLGNKYPDSGTPGRILINALAVPAHVASSGATAAGLLAGAAAYSRPVQNALVALLANRPDQAPAVANYLRKYLTTPATVAALPWVAQGTH